MALITIKQLPTPLLQSVTLPPPPAPDPYHNVRFGGWTDELLYICNDGVNWTLATVEEQIQNVPNLITDPSDSFFSKTDLSGGLTDLRFLGKRVLEIEGYGISLYEGSDFEKAYDSDTITFLNGNTLLTDKNYLITTND